MKGGDCLGSFGDGFIIGRHLRVFQMFFQRLDTGIVFLNFCLNAGKGAAAST